MIRMFCDICKKELAENCEDTVNLDFNSFGVSGFELKVCKRKPLTPELNLCVDCANKVVECIDNLADLAWMAKAEGR